MAHTQSLFDRILKDGARATKFDQMLLISNNDKNEPQIFNALIKTQQLPSISLEVPPLRYKGRVIPVRGQQNYTNTFSCSFYLSENHKLKKFLEDWLVHMSPNYFFQDRNRSVESFKIEKEKYNQKISIFQTNFEGTEDTIRYDLMNCFPRSISQINFDSSQLGNILELQVEFAYSHFESEIISDFDDKNIVSKFLDDIKSGTQELVEIGKGFISNAILEFEDLL